MMTFSSTMKLIPVVRFAMNWYKFGKQRVAMGLNVSAAIWIIPLEDSKGKCGYFQLNNRQADFEQKLRVCFFLHPTNFPHKKDFTFVL